MSRPVAFIASASFAIALLWSSAAAAQGVADAQRHYDARIGYNAAFIASQRALPAQTNKPFAANLQEAQVEADATTGAVSALTSQSGYLTDQASGAPLTLAMNFLRNNLTALGLEAADLQGYAVTDVVYSNRRGARRQSSRRRPIFRMRRSWSRSRRAWASRWWASRHERCPRRRRWPAAAGRACAALG